MQAYIMFKWRFRFFQVPVFSTCHIILLSVVRFPDVKASVKLHPGHRVACVVFVVHSRFQTCVVGGWLKGQPSV